MIEKKLSVKMFGRFYVSYGDEAIFFGKQRNSKIEQLFQILMTRPGQGVRKTDIAERLYKWEKVENLNASLNNTIFRLRKYLEASPLPSGDYLILDEGILRFSGKIEVESDVWEFEKIFKQFQEEQDKKKKTDFCNRACELYQGVFLPQLSNEQWVIEMGCSYQKMYDSMMEYLLGFLKEEGDYRMVERLAAQAVQICPYEGWENWQIDGLIELKRYQDAEELYRDTVAYIQETGGFLSKNQQEEYRKIGDRIQQPEGKAEDVRKYLKETALKQGAYDCMLLGFSDCYHMLKRIIRRGGICFSLLLCTILDRNGHPAKDKDYCEKQGEKLCMSFRTHLRIGDIYTKYSVNQYLLLCVGVGKENISEIGERIDLDFRKRCGGYGGISFQLLDDIS